MNGNNTNNEINNITNKSEKNIDNRIISTKEKIYNVDEKLDVAKKRINNLQGMQDSVNAIAKSMNRCIDLLSKSIKGPAVNNRLEDMRSTNKIFLAKSTASIEEETMAVRKTINELYMEKDRLIKENKQQYNQEQEKKEEKHQETLSKEEIVNNKYSK